MNSPLPELIDDRHIYISGEVIVHPSAAIAPGVFLQADPGCRLNIAAGACIGQGSVLHAYQGTIDVQTGAILGSGVLIVGRGQIGAHACVGAWTTVINCSVEAHQSIPPKSLIGDTSRQLTLNGSGSGVSPTQSVTNPVVSPMAHFTSDPWTEDPWVDPMPSSPPPSPPPQPPAPPAPSQAATPAVKNMTQVYGQAYVERIMITMFPHRRLLNNADSASTDSSSHSPPPEPP